MQKTLTKQQARRFLLRKHGLIGDYRFSSKQGILGFVEQAGCIQFDPIDICGRNAELVLQSRVEGFRKPLLYELLYEDRELLDYFDKNLSIIRLGDWKYFERSRRAHRMAGRGIEDVNKVADHIMSSIRERGPMCSKDFGLRQKVDWYWSDTNIARAALETLYFRGDLIIHHKKGSIKYYALAEDHIPAELLHAEDPLKSDFDHLKWRALRRISSVGLLWNKASDAFLNIRNFKSGERETIFKQLLEEERIIEVAVEGVKEGLYCLKSDSGALESALRDEDCAGRTELLAPLDNLLWDRKLIRAIFDFDYKWEIYTPEEQRKYGYYVLPLLSGDRFIGRAEIVNDRKRRTLEVRRLWYEDGVARDARLRDAIAECFQRFGEFNACEAVEMMDGGRF